MGGSNKKIAVAGVASILLVAAVVAVVVVNTKNNGTGPSPMGPSPTASHSNTVVSKTVQSMCAPTDYKETCEKSLAQANSTDPKDLIMVAFNATIKNIGDVLNSSALMQQAATDASTKAAFDVCKQVLERAIDDLRRSVDKVAGGFNATKVGEYVEDLKTWLSAVVTNQETCADAFDTDGDNDGDNDDGETIVKMRELLKSVKELSSNALAMVSEISTIVGSFGNNAAGRRRLLAHPALVFKNKREMLLYKLEHPDIVVAQDGSGQFKTINEAIARIPKNNNALFAIFVKAGVYKETVQIPKGANNVLLFGERGNVQDGLKETVITGYKNFADGVKTWDTATVAVDADDFFAAGITIENTAGPLGHQAVALRVSGDRAIFYGVNIYGYQDTLYAHTYRQFYSKCTISGTIDFIFGDALSIFQSCTFVVRKPGPNQSCMVTAQGRIERRSVGAIVIQNGNITAEPELIAAQPPHKAYLGRPWKELSRTIIMESNIDGFIEPQGWAPWAGNFALDTCYYGEYSNRGAGSNTTDRVKWKGIKKITTQIAESFTPGKAFGGDDWIKSLGLDYVPTLMHV